MNKHKLTLVGGPHGELRISAALLHEAVGALIEGARLATRFAVEGESVRKGPRPAWLDSACAVEITGLTAGSAAIAMEAPTLQEADAAKFGDEGQRSLFEEIDRGFGEQTAVDTFNPSSQVQPATSLLRSYESALNAADADAIVALYAEDAVFMAQHRSPAVGRDQIEAAYREILGTIRLHIEFEIDEVVVVSPTVAYARTRSAGTTTVLANDAQVSEGNQELFVLVRANESAEWRAGAGQSAGSSTTHVQSAGGDGHSLQEPAHPRLVTRRGAAEQGQPHWGKFEWRVAALEVIGGHQVGHDDGRNGEQQVRLGKDRGRHREVGHDGTHDPVQPLFCGPPADLPLPAAIGGAENLQMGVRRPRLGRPDLEGRVTLAAVHSPRPGAQGLAAHPLVLEEGWCHEGVVAGRNELANGAIAIGERCELDARTWRHLTHVPKQAWHQGSDEVRRSEPEGARRLLRPERLGPRERALQLQEDSGQGLRQSLSAHCRAHAPTIADQQLVPERFAEAPESVTDRRSSEVEPLGGAGDALLAQEHVEYHEQVQVDFFQVHFAHHRCILIT